MSLSTEERFWAKVDITDDCWLWTGYCLPGGYGRFRGPEGRNVLVHRFAYELLVGPIPEDRELDHRYTCPKNCVRPMHLRTVTKKQNLENRPGAYRNSQSGVRGVTWFSRDEGWVATVRHHGHRYWLGRFSTVEEAEAVVVAKRLELFTHNDLDRTFV